MEHSKNASIGTLWGDLRIATAVGKVKGLVVAHDVKGQVQVQGMGIALDFKRIGVFAKRHRGRRTQPVIVRRLAPLFLGQKDETGAGPNATRIRQRRRLAGSVGAKPTILYDKYRCTPTGRTV